MEEVALTWGIDLLGARPDIPICGSPERCIDRLVIEDISGELFIVEQLAPENIPRKQRIAETLFRLRQSGIETVFPYLPVKGKDGEVEFIVPLSQGTWQVAPYVPGIALKRPDYVNDGWRGVALAAFLAELYEKTPALPGLRSEPPFSLTEFIENLMGRLAQHDPEVYAKTAPVHAYLKESFFPAHDSMPLRFCHGDFHPLNIVWTCIGIAAVIDWEFMGYKRELYDIANLIGCVGMENPSSLTRELVMTLLRELYRNGLLNRGDCDRLFDFVLAQRFAWLSEWLYKSDMEMVDLECVYIQLLYDRRSTLRNVWQFRFIQGERFHEKPE